jgi:hypothetical protein
LYNVNSTLIILRSKALGNVATGLSGTPLKLDFAGNDGSILWDWFEFQAMFPSDEAPRSGRFEAPSGGTTGRLGNVMENIAPSPDTLPLCLGLGRLKKELGILDKSVAGCKGTGFFIGICAVALSTGTYFDCRSPEDDDNDAVKVGLDKSAFLGSDSLTMLPLEATGFGPPPS